MSRLEIDCKFCGFSIAYELEKISWESQNAELTIGSENEELVGYFKVWSNSVEPETIKGVRIKLEEKADSFALAMKFKGNHKLYIAKKNSYYFLGYAVGSGNPYMLCFPDSTRHPILSVRSVAATCMGLVCRRGQRSQLNHHHD